MSALRTAIALTASLLLVGCFFDQGGIPRAGPGNNANGNNTGNANGNNVNGNNNNLSPAVCGDGAIEGAEGCDDGNIAGGDGCGADCAVEAGWVCVGEPSVCTQSCGNGLLDPGEACDDGGILPGDGCSASCAVEPGWQCAGEPSTCQTICGDGIVVAGREACDDGNAQSGDGCTGTCDVEDFFACGGQPSLCACVVYVDLSAAGAGDGSSWDDAFPDVQSAINSANPLAQVFGTCDVWVAAGTYYIYQTTNLDTVTLLGQVGVYGGFTGSETQRQQRSWTANPTILSGRANGFPTTQVLHVVTANATLDATLDGFTVSGGFVPGGDIDGAGITLLHSNVTIANSIITDNQNADDGGGIYAMGGTLTLLDSEIFQNQARDDGGGVIIRGAGSAGIVRRCLFHANTGGDRGGGLMVHQGLVTVESSVFWQNTSPRGGGASLGTGANVTFTNCTFSENQSTAVNGGGIHVDGSTLTVVNSILWGDLPGALSSAGGSAVSISYSDFISLLPVTGTGNIGLDPLFVNPAGGDFHLQGGSPCIDSGDANAAPILDMEGMLRIDDPATPDTGVGTPPVDMGAFEYQP